MRSWLDVTDTSTENGREVQQVWQFRLQDLTIVLWSYVCRQRDISAAAWRPVELWNRVDRREGDLPEPPIVPGVIRAEVLERFRGRLEFEKQMPDESTASNGRD